MNATTDTAPPPEPLRGPSRVLVTVLYVSGGLTVLLGLALGIAVDPVLFAASALGLVDFLMGWLFATGRIGPDAQRRKAAAAQGDAATVAEADPSYNPYARED